MIVIVGESGSGKSELVKELSSYGINKVVTYTTRPKRNNEVNGIDYYFITKDVFDKYASTGFFIEHNAYRNWYYGTALDDCSNEMDIVAVLTPAGLRALKRSGVKVLSVYLEVDRRSRLINILKRGDDIEEAYRRSLSDVGQFDGVNEEVNYVINNDKYKKSISEVANELLKIIGTTKKER